MQSKMQVRCQLVFRKQVYTLIINDKYNDKWNYKKEQRLNQTFENHDTMDIILE